MYRYLFSVFCFLSISLTAQVPAYRNPTLPVEQRVDDLLSRMTPEEKFFQCFMIPGNMDSSNPDQYRNGLFGLQLSADAMQQAGAEMQILNYRTDTDAKDYVLKLNEIQRHFVENTRLGIPLIFFEEALHGLISHGATAFPQAIGLAATFDTTIMHQVAQAIATETKARGIRQVLSPVVNIANDVRWGRVEETYGEDPYLCSQMGKAYVGTLERAGIICTPKHFIANVGDGGRDSYPIDWNERLLREVHLPPFKACVEQAGARSIMTSYNSVNGSPATANTWLLDTLLKKEYGFKGFVISDAGAVGGANVLHYTAKDYTEASKRAISEGLDVILQTALEHYKLFIPPFLDGSIPQERIDDAVRRVLRAKFELGLFEQPYVPVGQQVDAARHREIALQSAEKSFVLLKNEGKTLPINPKKTRKIAVLGPDAQEVRLGGYSGPGNQLISILDGIVQQVGAEVEVKFAEGAQRKNNQWEVVPSTALFTNNDCATPGLQARYYKSVALTGNVVKQIDPQIEFRWTLFGPSCLQVNSFYSAEWTGVLVAPKSGVVNLGLEGNDGYRLFINDQLVIDRWSKQTFKRATAPITCQKGERLRIKVQFYEPLNNGSIKLIWDAHRTSEAETKLKQAVQVAQQSDIAVVVVGIEEGEFQDRALLNLPGNQEALIEAVAATGKPMVVVLVGGSAVTMQSWQDKAQAILQVWYPGEAGGVAVARTLFGSNNPGGKLPFSWPVHEGQLPLVYNHKPTGRGDDYLNLTGQALYPFGFGLSYTEFTFSDLRLKNQALSGSDSLFFSCTITNSGTMSGDEVVQVYLRDELASVARPIQELKAVRRVTLEAGQSTEILFAIAPEAFKMYDRNLRSVTESGSFLVMVGASSRDIRLQARVQMRD